ncbi:MAG: DUF3307 domain-containing protein [Bacteroidota bacterium]|nr:DUF3307 domain-containing protein [Bacteroidota bacterium]MDQ6888927.1 DUF3307 domain-containing protein [Bacteroidota bacterium]
MLIESTWLLKLLLAHLLTDFVLQPGSWIKDRNNKHFISGKLYLHGFVTATVAWILIGWKYWLVALVILITHTLIDAWKSYQKQNSIYFLVDQLLHILVIAACWYFTFIQWSYVQEGFGRLNNNSQFWLIATGCVFLTTPAGILIGQLTKNWRDQIPGSENLANAGKWIGIIERIIILIFVMQNQYSAIGLLIAAKGIIRFNEKDRQEIKTEYLVIGTLLSIGLAIVTGLLIKW